jgi:hypothetical protein
MQFEAFYLMTQGKPCESRSQSQGIYNHGLSQFGLRLRKMPIGLISFYCGQRHIYHVQLG